MLLANSEWSRCHLSFLPPFIPPAFLLISQLRDHRVAADILLIDNSSQQSPVPRSPAAQMNSALSDQRSRTAPWVCTTHGSSGTEVEAGRDPRRGRWRGKITHFSFFRQPAEKRNSTNWSHLHLKLNTL